MPEVEAVETSVETPTVDVTINGNTYTIGELFEPGRKTKTNANPKPVMRLDLVTETFEARGAFVADVLAAAEAKKAGDGDSVWQKITKKYFAAILAAVTNTDGEVDPDKIPEAAVATRHTGVSEDDINELRAAVQAEMEPLMALMLLSVNEDKTDYHAKLAELGFADEDEYVGKVMKCQNQLRDISQAQEKLKAQKDARDVRRAQKAKEEADKKVAAGKA